VIGKGGGSRCGRLFAATTVLVMIGCGVPHWPVEGPLIAPFGVRWTGSGLNVHRGVDIVVPTGTPVYAMTGGKVRFTGWMTDYGNVVWVDHSDAVVTVYAHLSQILVVEGQSVTREAALGLSGESGNASGPHLHFEIRGRGRHMDPVALLGGPPGL